MSLTYLYTIRGRKVRRGLVVKVTAKQAVVKGLYKCWPDSVDRLRAGEYWETWAEAHAALCEDVADSARVHKESMQRELDLLAKLGGAKEPVWS